MVMVTKAKKRERGRPPKPEGKRKGVIFHVRLTGGEMAELTRQARAAGITLTDALMHPWRKEKARRLNRLHPQEKREDN